MKKLIPVILSILLLSICLSACNQTSYRDDIDAVNVAGEMLHYANIEGGCSAADSDHVALEFPSADVVEQSVSDWWIYVSTSSSTVDEFGVFHVKDGQDVNAVKAAVEEYVQAMKVKLEVFLDSYEPAEKTKLDNALVKVYGNYVIYTMLSEQDTADVHNMLSSYLAAK